MFESDAEGTRLAAALEFAVADVYRQPALNASRFRLALAPVRFVEPTLSNYHVALRSMFLAFLVSRCLVSASTRTSLEAVAEAEQGISMSQVWKQLAGTSTTVKSFEPHLHIRK